jgi:transcription initiation factor TFIID subunit 13
MLAGYGAPGNPLDPAQSEPYPETLRVLDEIVTDFIIETCHAVVEVAAYSGRQKLKTSDFEFVLRKDPAKVGHVQSMFEKKRNLDTQRRGADFDQLGTAGKIGVDDLAALAQEAGEEGTRKGVGRGKGRRKREREKEEGGADGDGDGASGDGTTERGSKKARSEG